MVPSSPAQHPWPWPRTLLDVLLRAGLLAILAVACYRVFQPFLDLMVWAVILAVTLNPLQGWVRRHLHWREGHIATLIVVLIILVLLVPVYFIARRARCCEERTLPRAAALRRREGVADRG